MDTREVRHFELEADRRARRFFLFVVIGFAILAVAGGIFAAYLLLEDETTPEIAPPKAKPPEPVEDFGDGPPVAFRDDEPPQKIQRTPSRLQETLDNGDIGKGMSRLQAAFDACARTHGALEGTIVAVDFSVAGTGRVEDSASRPPNGKTPLGLCVAGVVKTGSFAKSRNGRRDIRWSVKLHP